MSRLFTYLKRILGIGVLLGLLALCAIYIAHTVIVNNAIGRTYTNVKAIPSNKVGLVLGTSKLLQNGRVNLYFTYRINATANLYRNGKIKYILVSGDNGNSQYDEPTDFKNALIEKGVPAHKIYLDYAGFRTLDSVVRAKEVFGQNQYTIISQKFHNERAIYIAKSRGMDVIGFNAKDVSAKFGLKVRLREYLARVKVFGDHLFNVQPKFLGKQIVIGE